MDTSELIIDYSESDFADSIRALLPKGEYWQETDNQELTNTIKGMAIDFKATHDDIELSLLSDLKEKSFGWKLSDYQGLLNEIGSVGVVYDDVKAPNLIKINLFSYDNNKAFAAFEKKRLPHTDFAWIYPFDAKSEISQTTALIIKPTFSSEIGLKASTQTFCSIAMSWELEIGESA